MILVTGATGQFGSKVVDHLLKKGISPNVISVLVRSAAKADRLKEQGVRIKEGDYTDPASMIRAFEGIDKLLLVSSNDRQAVENRTLQHKNAIMAAREAGVKHVMYTSFVRRPGFEKSSIAGFQNSHVESERYLKESSMEYTILQNAIYAEMILAFIGDKVVENGAILFPAASGNASWVLRDELAEAAAQILITDGHSNKTYTLTNTESVDFKTIAQQISEIVGKEINYQSPEIDEFKSILENAGVPDMYIGMFIMWAKAVAQHTMDKTDDTLTQFLGRKPTTVSQFLKQVYG